MAAIPSSSDWLRNTYVGRLSRRGADLERVDAAVAEFERSRNRAALEALAAAFREWKRKNTSWITSDRNRTGALTEMGAAIAQRLDPMLEQQDYIWCPGPDDEMRECAENMIEHLGLFPRLFSGGEAGLEKFSAKARLYILSHGHSQSPAFPTDHGTWSAAQLAARLLGSVLNPEIRTIEMLVCH
ncbi:MAG: hypothetical protein JWO88_3574, partial [Frankiales bacterium]|nr:hypothetical protein [Frankiales bacterium]